MLCNPHMSSWERLGDANHLSFQCLHSAVFGIGIRTTIAHVAPAGLFRSHRESESSMELGKEQTCRDKLDCSFGCIFKLYKSEHVSKAVTQTGIVVSAHAATVVHVVLATESDSPVSGYSDRSGLSRRWRRHRNWPNSGKVSDLAE